MENKEQKTNPFLKALKALGHYFKFVFVDFFASFKYNNMKLPAILIALPGILIGFFLSFHIPTVKSIIPNYTREIAGASGEYLIQEDTEAPVNYFYKITMNNVRVDQKSTKTYNLVLKRDYVTGQEGTKLPKPVLSEAPTVEGEELVLKVATPTGEGAD